MHNIQTQKSIYTYSIDIFIHIYAFSRRF